MLPIGRRRLAITTPTPVLTDLLSWRFDRLRGASALLLGNRTNRTTNAAERQEFKTFINKIEAMVDQDIQKTTRQMSSEWIWKYNPNINLKPQDAKAGHKGKLEEDFFLEHLCKLLSESRYHLLSAEEWEYADENAYSFTLPTRVKWSTYDDKLLSNVSTRVYQQESVWRTAGDNSQGKVNPPPEATRILCFHRGVGMDRRTELFYGDKMDEIIRRCALYLYKKLLSYVHQNRARVAKRARQAHKDTLKRSASFYGMISRNIQTKFSAFQAQAYYDQYSRFENILRNQIALHSSRLPDISVDNVKQSIPEALSQRFLVPGSTLEVPKCDPIVEENIPTKDTLLEAAMRSRIYRSSIPMNLWNILMKITLQEPTYKQVVVVYRMAEMEPSTVITTDQARRWKLTGQNQENLVHNNRNIFVKHFRDVPMADIELLFPEKQVFLSVTNRLSYGMMSGIGILALVPLLHGEHASFWSSPAWMAAAFASGSYFARMASKMYMSWAYNSVLTNSFLADNVNATGAPAITLIGSEAREQVVKEIAVVYLAVLELCDRSLESSESSNTFTAQQISSQAHKILSETCSPELAQFDPSHALDYLVNFQVLRKNTGNGTFHSYTLRSPVSC
mmetsp:Transcript_5260/g.8065  ORF Transcript_5260/g.8065 Transcript_5260/m.8065 type:complete len:620 (-) Transcript_5260:220-2079(-)